MAKRVFQGSLVALVTPFRDEKVDEAKLKELVEFQIHGLSRRRPRCHGADLVLRRPREKSSAGGHAFKDLRAALVLRRPEGKSSEFLNAGEHLHPPLVLPRAQQDSAQVGDEVRPHRAELVLGYVPGKMRKRRGKLERLERRSFFFTYASRLQPAGREVVAIPSTPPGLRPRPSRHLARPLRARPLPGADSSVGIKPPAADTAGALLEHPTMLGLVADNVDGPFLASRGGSIFASA